MQIKIMKYAKISTMQLFPICFPFGQRISPSTPPPQATSITFEGGQFKTQEKSRREIGWYIQWFTILFIKCLVKAHMHCIVIQEMRELFQLTKTPDGQKWWHLKVVLHLKLAVGVVGVITDFEIFCLDLKKKKC